MLRHLLAIATVLAGIGVLAWFDGPFMRYLGFGNVAKCSAAQILNLPDQIDVLAVGSSRVRRGLSAKVMIEASGGQIDSVYNLGRQGREIIRSYILLRDLVARGTVPKVVVMEADIDNLRGQSDRGFTLGGKNVVWATYPDLLRHGVEFGGFTTTLHAIAAKTTQDFVLTLTGAPIEAMPALAEPSPTVCFQSGFDEPNEKTSDKQRSKEAEIRRGANGSIPDWDDDFTFVDSEYNRAELHYVEKIRVLARNAGIRLIVIRPFGYLDPPMTDEVIAEIRELIPEYKTPPAVFVRTNAENFMDATHFDPEGRRNFTIWLTGQILADGPIR